MATPAEYTIGTNAAMAVAQADINQLVPSFFRSDIPLSDVQKFVADVIKAGIDAIDASRSTPTKGT